MIETGNEARVEGDDCTQGDCRPDFSTNQPTMKTNKIPRTKREAMTRINTASLEQLLEWERIGKNVQPTDVKLAKRNSAWIARFTAEIKREIDRRYQDECSSLDTNDRQ